MTEEERSRAIHLLKKGTNCPRKKGISRLSDILEKRGDTPNTKEQRSNAKHPKKSGERPSPEKGEMLIITKSGAGHWKEEWHWWAEKEHHKFLKGE